VPFDGDTDYRQSKLAELPVYVTPLGEKARQVMDAAWDAAVSGHEENSRVVEVKGRKIHIPRANGRVARFSFEELCARPLAARDYLAIAAAFDTIFIDDIPVLQPDQRNEAKRLILLIDTLYDKGTKLIASAEAEPGDLYPQGTGREIFEFERTASRLIEMRGSAWGNRDS